MKLKRSRYCLFSILFLICLSCLDRGKRAEGIRSVPTNIEILLPTQYRKDSNGYPENIESKNWYEMYKDPKTGEWFVAQTELCISYGYDECVGEDVMIVKSKNEDAVFFFTLFDGLSKMPVTIIQNIPLVPGREVDFTYKGINFQLLPKGFFRGADQYMMSESELKAKTLEELIDNYRIMNYRLSFRAYGKILYEIAAIDNIEFTTPRLLWAGDLNGDGLPDVILDLSDFYQSQHIFLFLSDKNDKATPLKSAANLKVVNDC